MSIPTTCISCTGCDFQYAETYRPITLNCRMECGVVSYSVAQAWCYRCHTIRYAEYIPSIEEIREEYTELYGVPVPNLKWWRKFINRGNRQSIESQRELECTLAWREARTAPPHCLTCWSTRLEILQFKNVSGNSAIAEGFTHSCGGSLIHNLGATSAPRFHFQPTVIWVDLVGNVLERE